MFSGVAGIVGGSVPCCCKKSYTSLIALLVASLLSFALRCTVIITLVIAILSVVKKINKYETCVSGELQYLNQTQKTVAAITAAANAKSYCSFSSLGGAPLPAYENLQVSLEFGVAIVAL